MAGQHSKKHKRKKAPSTITFRLNDHGHPCGPDIIWQTGRSCYCVYLQVSDDVLSADRLAAMFGDGGTGGEEGEELEESEPDEEGRLMAARAQAIDVSTIHNHTGCI